MRITELLDAYELEKNHAPETFDDLLDYYQQKYISGEIDISKYRRIYSRLNAEGAVSAHERVSTSP
ncbi:YppF family protein [Virgibacillus xinjiangensis]|uniref:YppF family protein n=1 Tax=Virgibacillus xinjiangensis TaxID=393090 RepID=A0ABV7CW21_9BACI